jgi:transposase
MHLPQIPSDAIGLNLPNVPNNITPIFVPSRAPELNPVENFWQYLRQNWLSNTVFENYDAIVDAACAAWRKLIAQPQTITCIECATGLMLVSRNDP